jgi:hypothetical protein
VSISTLIRRMSEAGAPAEAIALAVEEIEAMQSLLDGRRMADRDRKRAQRERQKSADVTGQSEDSHGTVTDKVSLDKKVSQTLPKINPIPCVRDTRARWHRLPENWQPRPLPQPVQAKVDQWPPGALDDELAAMRRWAANAEDKNGKGRKLDWDQAWRNWIGRRHDERHSRQPANSNNGLGKSAAAFAMLNPGDEPF